MAIPHSGSVDGGKLPYPIADSQIEVMVGFLKRLMVDPEAAGVEEAMWLSEDYKRVVWKKLVCFEDHKRFFRRELVGVLQGFKSEVLGSIDMCGTVDEMWMKAVARATGVTVRARDDEDDEWIAAKPSDVE